MTLCGLCCGGTLHHHKKKHEFYKCELNQNSVVMVLATLFVHEWCYWLTWPYGHTVSNPADMLFTTCVLVCTWHIGQQACIDCTHAMSYTHDFRNSSSSNGHNSNHRLEIFRNLQCNKLSIIIPHCLKA